jgi:hypothetical protein
MKNLIIRFRLENLRNETHVEYNETVDGLVLKYNPQTLGISVQYGAYKSALEVEVSVLDVVRKSEYTIEINAQDHVRDGIFRGFADAVQSVCRHFNPDKRKSAGKISVALEQYGNIAAKTFDQESAAIDDLLRELNDRHSDDVTLLGLSEWTKQLDTENQTFKQLMSERYTEAAQRPATRMKSARAETDKTLRTMLDMVDALARVNGDAAYLPFINELNAVSARYRNQLAQTAGRRPKPEGEN